MERVAVVTGGARGIGFAVAQRLQEDGFLVVIADTSTEGHDALGVHPKILRPFVVNVALLSDVQKLTDWISTKFSTVHVLVNNAGILPRTGLESISPSDWDYVLAVNLKSVFLCCQAMAPLMETQKSGRIINIASMVAHTGGETTPAHYVASKGGVISLTRHLAKRYGPKGVTVNAVCPGFIDTAQTSGFLPVQRQEFEAQIPLGRFGKPEDVAAVVAFLASEDSRYVTGASIEVNGGCYFA